MADKGPALDPVKVQQFEAGFNGQPINPKPQSAAGFASAIAQAYAKRLNGGQAAAPQPSPSVSPAPMNPHVMAMQEAAEAAKQKYMRENGVDENGDPVSK